MTARRHVPFGSHWAMGIAVPYSLGVIDGGVFWSCGQCPLDREARVLHPGDLAAQLVDVAGLIRDQFAPHGIAPGSIAKLVAYVAGDAAELDLARRYLSDALAPVPLVIVAGVPPFYYAGMRVEIDVYGAEEPPQRLPGGAIQSGDFIHIAGPPARIGEAMTVAGLSPAQLLSGRLHIARGTQPVLPDGIVWDKGAAIAAALPDGQTALADLVFAAGEAVAPVIREMPGGVILTRRKAGRYVGLLGRSSAEGQTLAGAARAIMEAFAVELAQNGLGFADVVKQQTHYIGGANAEDLYANMTIRNGYYRTPGPASTGLAVAGIAGEAALITVEVIACRG